MAQQHKATQAMIRMVAEFVASRQEPTTRSDVIQGLKLTESPSTVYRWLNDAVSQGLVHRTGDLKSAAYNASVTLRAEIMRRNVRQDVNNRPRVGYITEFMESYQPGTSHYLDKNDLAKLMARCPPGTMPMANFSDHELSMFMNDLSYSSSRLEGNQYDLAGTIALLEHDIANASLPLRDKIQIINHRQACRFLIDGVRDSVRDGTESFQLSSTNVRSVHLLLASDLLGDQQLCGTLRTKQVGIRSSSYVPLAIPAQIKHEFEKMIAKANRIKNPFEQAFFLLVHMPYIQPFADCNKRTARVVCNLPLLRGGITPLSWLDTDQRDYTEACLAIYEHNDPALMAEVFVHSFMRAAERFSDMQRQREPDPISAMYRPEIRDTIRARILHDEEYISPNISLDNAADFLAYVDTELGQMCLNSMLGVRYGLTAIAVEAWAVQRASEADEKVHARERG